MAAETFEGPTVIIDLGLARGEPDEYAAPTRSTVPDWFAPVMVAVLVLFGSTASAAPPPPALTPLLSMRVGPADPYTLTDNGDLLAQSLGVLTSYDLRDGHLRWQAGSAMPTFRLRTGDGLILLRPFSGNARVDPGTTAVALDNGSVRWRRSGSVVTVTGSSTLLAVSNVRSFSGPGRRVQGSVEAVDPATGRTTWAVPVPSTAVLLGVPGPAESPWRMLLVHDNRTAAVHDLTTGAELVEAQLPPADYGPDNPVLSGGLLLLRHPTLGGRMVSAFDPVTLQPRWTRPAGSAFGVTTCGALACLAGPDGVRAVDPADGALRWYRPAWRSVEQRGGLVLAFGTPAGENDPVGVIDPDTGEVVTDLDGWRPVPGAGGGDHLLVTRTANAGARTMVAVAAPDGAQPELLADLPPGTGDCQAVPARLVCRSTSGDLTVWAYQRKG
ncbi:PQQ-binding-like beta-propeller repeat protein [Couchioplanes caeruleus]|uniref:outer membrane protein assembly factor BamB family protein n=1 Tax=Couchioplanes caeruleus TaxID=56438 RepID=UPI0020BE6D3B|nr:PQQ-binding-like beta-propeller repeat protein [Couchioplanes caeruleus]UQU66395.1 PQQ-binding-like beta-propeller repeat protein [Couchioplanes caeruleus]